MTAVEDILDRVPLADVAHQLGVSEAEVENLARQSIPILLGGMRANASDPAGAASLEGALHDHAGDDPGVFSLGEIDVADGSKIVGNIFGSNADQVVQSLSARSEQGSGLVGKLLPILAPIVLRYLASKVLGGGAGSAAGSAPPGSAGGGLLGGILNELLTGRSGAPRSPARERAETPSKSDGPTFDSPSGRAQPGGDSKLTVPGYSDENGESDHAESNHAESDQPGEDSQGPGSLLNSLKDLFGMGRRG